MTPDEFNTIAWSSFLEWAWNEPEMRAEFTAATGVAIADPKSPIERVVDAATGASRSVVTAFIEWATREHWGLEDAPAAYRATLEATGGVLSKPEPEPPARVLGPLKDTCIGCGQVIHPGELVRDYEEGAAHAGGCPTSKDRQ